MEEAQKIQSVTPPVKPEPKKFWNKKTIIITAVSIVLLLAVIAGAVFVRTRQNKQNNENTNIETTPTPTATPTTEPTPTPTNFNVPSILSGKVEKYNKDLGLYINDTIVTYFTAGVITSGTYKDYTRVIAVIDPQLGHLLPELFVTKDFKTFTRDKYSNGLMLYDDINTKKVTKQEFIDSEHPRVIPLDDKYALMRTEIVAESDAERKNISLNQNLSGSKILPNFNSTLKIYTPEVFQADKTGTNPDSVLQIASENFLDTTSKFYAVDETGLSFVYQLTTRENADNLAKNEAAYFVEWAKNTYPWYGDYLKPYLRFKKSEINTNKSLYKDYFGAFPGACGSDFDTTVTKNLKDDELEKVGSSGKLDLYVMKNKNHPLYKWQYHRKVEVYEGDADMFKQANENKTIPTFDQYVASDPLLFVKDYFGRWVVLGEYEIITPGGCGKPVVYLYPEKTTQVNLRFTGPIKLDVNIPTYDNGWNVLASPDGTLKNLNNKTNCESLKTSHFGSEYAYDACKKNSYPYIYWSGQSYNANYPKQTQGWYVERNNLETFLKSKLKEAGLNEKESKDMMEYWVPTLLKKNKSYYRISFLQTQEMNQLAPMDISPKPDTVFRIFLDWDAYDSKPSTNIQPQQLNKLERRGFTVVEWGGLKK